MVPSNHYLLVVLIAEGRRFPKKPNEQLVLESRFDGELLATDPVVHLENPVFNSELAWEVSKKLLHQYKLQRTPIKLQCYAVNLQTKRRESIGYILLDLRTAAKQEESPALVPARKKWYPLLNSKYSRLKPELQLALSLEVDTGPRDESFHAKAAPPRKGKANRQVQYDMYMSTDLLIINLDQCAFHKDAPTPDSTSESSLDPKVLTPLLNSAEGFFQIGPPDSCVDKFILSVTIAFANNLTELVPSTIPLPHRESGFFFYYKLFGNDVSNETFKDLMNPNFSCERASVHIRSSVDVLRIFFEKEPKLEIHLCCGDQVLGSATIRLDLLLSPPSDVINQRPVTIEGAFPLTSPASTKEKVKGTDCANVGASVVLRREDIEPAEQQSQVPPKLEETKEDHKSQERPPEGKKQSQVPQEARDRGRKGKRPSGKQKRAREHDSDEDTDKEIDSIVEEEDDQKPGRDLEKGLQSAADGDVKHRVPDKDKKRKDAAVSDPGGVTLTGKRPPSVPTRLPSQQPTTSQHSQNFHPSLQPIHQSPPSAICHYGFSIDLRSIRNVNTSTALNIYLRYSYPFFGSSSPIMTHPPVEILNRHMEVYLPNSFCAFDFATSGQQLHDTLNRTPLSVELWHRDKLAKDLLLGIAEVSLASVLQAPRIPVTSVDSPHTQGWRQICSEKVVAKRPSENQTPVAEVLVALGLEDFGPINTRQVFLSTDSSERSKAAKPVEKEDHGEEEVSAPPDPRETMEYKTAMELEMWKEQQADLFENQMKEKEVHRLQSLAEEFKRRDKERELLLKKKLDEYSHLEEQLRFALAEVEKREKQLATNEDEIGRLRDDLQREHERKLTEMQEASRRMKEDCIHQIELEKSKARILQEEIQHLTEMVKNLQQTVQQKERDFEMYKEQSSTKPEIKLQSEISMLTLEKVELERKLESLTKSKIHYKQQWGRALKELAHLKEKQQSEAKARLVRQQQELEHMRLRYLAAEEKEVIKAENLELQDIRGELQRLQEQEVAKKTQVRQTTEPSNSHPSSVPPPSEKIEERPPYPFKQPVTGSTGPVDEHVARLIEERDTLMRTGVYNHQDRIILELDRQIRDAIAQSGS